jgi:hypothetical protein
VPVARRRNDEAINIIASKQITVVKNSFVPQRIRAMFLRFLNDSDCPVTILLVDVTNGDNSDSGQLQCLPEQESSTPTDTDESATEFLRLSVPARRQNPKGNGSRRTSQKLPSPHSLRHRSSPL